MNGTISNPSPLSEATGEHASPPVPITTSQVRAGDILIYEGREIEITAPPRPGWYWFGAERHEGAAIDWRAGTARGILFRRGGESMYRVRKG